MGVDSDCVVGNPPKEFICAVCTDISVDPVLCHDHSQSFCRECIEQCDTCPICRTPKDIKELPNILRSIHDSIPLECENRPACKWKGEMQHYQNHLKHACEALAVPCEVCGEQVSRPLMKEHIMTAHLETILSERAKMLRRAEEAEAQTAKLKAKVAELVVHLSEAKKGGLSSLNEEDSDDDSSLGLRQVSSQDGSRPTRSVSNVNLNDSARQNAQAKEGNVLESLKTHLLDVVLPLLPSQTETHFVLGWLLMCLKNFPDAIQRFNWCIARSPFDQLASSFYERKAQCLYSLNKVADAEKCYEMSVERNPRNAVANFGMGKLYFHVHKDNRKAKKYYVRAIDSDPRHSMAHNNLAVVFEEALDFDSAETEYKKAFECNKDNSKAMVNLAFFYDFSRRNYSKAEEWYLKAHGRGHPQAQYWYARMLGEKLSRWPEAVKHMKESAKSGHTRAIVEVQEFVFKSGLQ